MKLDKEGWTTMGVLLLTGILGTLLGVQATKPAEKPPTFRETFFTQLDKANAVYEEYSHISCTDKDFPDVEVKMRNEYLALKHLATLIQTEEKDVIQQDHELESYGGFYMLLREAVNQQQDCATPNPKNSTAKGSDEGNT